MSLSNSELAKRADLALSDLETNGGKLLPEQANTFIDLILDQPTLLRQARVVRMSAPTRKINRMGFANRILTAGRSSLGQASGPYASEQDAGDNPRYVREADRAAPTTAQIELNTKEVIAEVRLSYEVLEDNIEGDGLEAHIMRLIAERVAIDLEEWALQASTLSGDAYLALTEGLLRQVDVAAGPVQHIVDNLSAGISPDLFEAAMLEMPQQYMRNLTGLRQYITVQDNIKYRANVAKRATGYGDSALQESGQLVAFGVPVEQAPLMPAATGLFTFPNNVIWGVQRDILVETDKDIRSREMIIVLTARVDVLFDEVDAVVKLINI